MTIPAIKAMRRMCELRDWSISNLEVNKLLYFAHMIALGEHGRPLVSSNFEAWDLGPVLPDAYHKAKMFGAGPIKSFIFSGRGEVKGWEPVFRRTVEEFGAFTGGRLVAESHWKDGAWAEHYRPGSRGIEIPNDDIADEYRRRVSD